MTSSITNIKFYEQDIKIEIQDDLDKDFNDEKLKIILYDITTLKNYILILLNDLHDDQLYMSRQKTAINNNIKTNILNYYVLYQNKIIEYYRRLDILKTTNIKNYDYLLDWYNNTKKELNNLNIEYDKLKYDFDKYKKEYSMNDSKINSHCIEQSIKVEALNSELADVRNQRDFLKGLNNKNKEIINNLQKQLNEKIKDYELLNIENINNNDKIDNHLYEFEKVLNDRKYIIDNNVLLREQFNTLKTNYDNIVKLTETNENIILQITSDKEKLEDSIIKNEENYSKQIQELNNLIHTKDSLLNKILSQVSELIPSYTWNDKYGFVSKEYEIIYEEK